jgi:hypothetical protein
VVALEDIFKWSALCEAMLDACIVERIPRDDVSSALLSRRILHRLSVSERIGVLQEIIDKDVFTDYTALPANLQRVIDFRNVVAPSIPGRHRTTGSASARA